MLYDQNKASTVRQDFADNWSGLGWKSQALTISRMYQYLGEDTKHGRLIQKNTVKSLDNRIVEECSTESREKLSTELLTDKCQLILADFRDVDSATIAADSIDLIFTDPPYKEADLPVYKDLGLFASRVLRPGGDLVCYAGHYALPEIFDYMRDSGSELTYWWTICVKHNGGWAKMWKQRTWVHWKPLLWFCKGDRPDMFNDIHDYIESQPVEQRAATNGSITRRSTTEYMIKHLTVENEIVLDPFMGSGTLGIAALNLHRRLSNEIDEN